MDQWEKQVPKPLNYPYSYRSALFGNKVNQLAAEIWQLTTEETTKPKNPAQQSCSYLLDGHMARKQFVVHSPQISVTHGQTISCGLTTFLTNPAFCLGSIQCSLHSLQKATDRQMYKFCPQTLIYTSFVIQEALLCVGLAPLLPQLTDD